MTFLNLSEYYLVELLTLWIGHKSVAKFDSAVCNKLFRHQVLQLMQSNIFCLSMDDKELENPRLFYKWISSRSIHFKKLCLSHWFHAQYPILSFKLAKVMELQINTFIEHTDTLATIITVINSCNNLTHLSLSHIFTDELIILITIFSQLKVLNLASHSVKFTSKSVEYLTKKCDLVTLGLCFKSYESYEVYNKNVFVNLFQQNKHLVNLELHFNRCAPWVGFEELGLSFSIYRILSQYCNSMLYCRVKSYGSINIADVCQFISVSLNLKELTTTHNNYQLSGHFQYEKKQNTKFIYLQEHCRLQTVNINALFKTIHDFTTIKLSRLSDFSDNSLISISENNYRTLLALDINTSHMHISMGSLIKILTDCKKLINLAIWDYGGMFDYEDFILLIDVPNILTELHIAKTDICYQTLQNWILMSERLEIFSMVDNNHRICIDKLKLFCDRNKPTLTFKEVKESVSQTAYKIFM